MLQCEWKSLWGQEVHKGLAGKRAPDLVSPQGGGGEMTCEWENQTGEAILGQDGTGLTEGGREGGAVYRLQPSCLAFS